MPTYKATAYIRLSYTDDRSSESDSVANQRKLIENFVERNPDIEVVSYKVDDGYSGIIFDRPAFKEMMIAFSQNSNFFYYSTTSWFYILELLQLHDTIIQNFSGLSL